LTDSSAAAGHVRVASVPGRTSPGRAREVLKPVSRRAFLRALGLGLVTASSLLSACANGPTEPTGTKSGTPILYVRTLPEAKPTSAKYKVSVLHCPPEATDTEIESRVAEAIDQVVDLQRALQGKRKVFLKPNMAGQELARYRGRLQALTDPAVLRGVVAAIRRHYQGEIVIGEAPTTTQVSFTDIYASAGYAQALKGFNVRTIDLNQAPFVELGVPGGGLMFSRYTLSRELANVDFVVSVAKMKSHVSAGVTLTLKNLFGLPPISIYGCPRRYLHSLIRLPRVLVDMGLIFRPDLCVVDGLVGQNGKEWDGWGADTEVLIAGNNVVATDATACRFMGVDPLADYGQAPFLWDRNPLRLAHDAKLGSARADDIELSGDDWSRWTHPQFYVERTLSADEPRERQSLVEQARAYLQQRDGLLREHAGQIVCFQDSRPAFFLPDASGLGFEPGQKGSFLWGPAGMGSLLKRVLPAEEDPEHMEVYDQIQG